MHLLEPLNPQRDPYIHTKMTQKYYITIIDYGVEKGGWW